MTRHFVPVLSVFALTVAAGAACAGSLPASGEQPFFEDSVGSSILTRAEVVAAAVATPPATGEMSSAPAVVPAYAMTPIREAVTVRQPKTIDLGERVPMGDAS